MAVGVKVPLSWSGHGKTGTRGALGEALAELAVGAG
jgi:hypothetical protein